jgi:hypothetical protein
MGASAVETRADKVGLRGHASCTASDAGRTQDVDAQYVPHEGPYSKDFDMAR